MTLLKSFEGRTAGQRSTVRGLGLKKIGQSVEIPLTPQHAGMIKKVEFMLRCEEV